MKHWHETSAILDRVARLAESGGRAAIATVVRISGSAYRRPGAKFLVEEGGRTTGGVSGGCLEADVREVALEVMRAGAPRLLHYDTGSDDETVWGLGLGCEGAVDIFVQPVGAELIRSALAPVRELLSGGTAFGTAVPFAVATVVEGAQAGWPVALARGSLAGTTGDPGLDAQLSQLASRALESGQSRLEELGVGKVFIDVFTPPPVLLIFGAGDDAQPLSRLAAEAGFEVTVVDHRRGYLTPERFPPPVRLVLRRPAEGISGLGRRHFAVVQTHALAHDRDWLRALLPQPLAYLGLLGPRARKDEILRQLGPGEPRQLFAPVGLDLGAEGPEQVAISIVAEMLAAGAARAPVHLREKTGGIHEG